MRTTVEITDEQRAQLLALAARRGEKGFSSLVREALNAFLAAERSRQAAVRRAVATRGKLARNAEALRAHSRRLRESWR